MVKTQIHPEVEASIRSQFSSERILWRGTPDPVAARRAARPILLFAIPWTLFALLWEGIALATALRGAMMGRWAEYSTWVMPLWGIPFVVVGLALLSSPWYAGWQARNTVLLLTDERLAAIRRGRSRIVSRYTPFDAVTTVEVSVRRDGIGHIKLVRGKSRDSDGDLVERAETYEYVRNVARLEAQLREAIRTRRG